jgi:hypothetical protein
MLVIEVHKEFFRCDAIDKLMPHAVVVNVKLTALVYHVVDISRRKEYNILAFGIFEARNE